jgi:hypothetical protein
MLSVALGQLVGGFWRPSRLTMSTTGKTGGDRAEMLPAYVKIVRGIGSNTLMLGKFGYESLQWKVLTSSYIGVVTFLLTQIEPLVPD